MVILTVLITSYSFISELLISGLLIIGYYTKGLSQNINYDWSSIVHQSFITHNPTVFSTQVPSTTSVITPVGYQNHLLPPGRAVPIISQVFRDAFRFARSIGALDASSKPPALTEANAQRRGER